MGMTVNIRKEFEELIAKLVESGRFTSAADVVDNALFFLEERELNREAKLARLRAEIQKGFDSGPAEPFDPKELAEDIKRQGREQMTAETRAAEERMSAKLAAENG